MIIHNCTHQLLGGHAYTANTESIKGTPNIPDQVEERSHVVISLNEVLLTDNLVFVEKLLPIYIACSHHYTKEVYCCAPQEER